jgi:DNA-directed RNA polymerase specialized sigma24 family protein
MNEFDSSVSQWLEDFKQGDEAAAKLWDRYFQRLVGLARKKLRQRYPRGVEDGGDVALSAYHAFSQAARGNHFPHLQDREGLWKVLVTITERKVNDLVAREKAAKRGGGMTQGESALGGVEDSTEVQGLARVADPGPTPDLVVELDERFQQFLDSLADEKLLQTVVLKMEGYSNDEIAQRLQVVPPTVRRWLRLLQEKAELHFGASSSS